MAGKNSRARMKGAVTIGLLLLASGAVQVAKADDDIDSTLDFIGWWNDHFSGLNDALGVLKSSEDDPNWKVLEDADPAAASALKSCLGQLDEWESLTEVAAPLIECLNSQEQDVESWDEPRVGGGREEILGYCAGEWPDDYQMQEHCVETQSEAQANVQKWAKKYFPRSVALAHTSSDERDRATREETLREPERSKILRKCSQDWPPPQWQMTWHCIRTQEEALERLQRRGER